MQYSRWCSSTPVGGIGPGPCGWHRSSGSLCRLYCRSRVGSLRKATKLLTSRSTSMHSLEGSNWNIVCYTCRRSIRRPLYAVQHAEGWLCTSITLQRTPFRWRLWEANADMLPGTLAEAAHTTVPIPRQSLTDCRLKRKRMSSVS